MKESDSRECRNCHNFDYMDFTLQETRAASEHQRAIDTGMTCIDCHQGIAHSLPPGYLETYQDIAEAVDGKPLHKQAAVSGNDIRSFLNTNTD
jgi:cytochrome c-type protein NapC